MSLNRRQRRALQKGKPTGAVNKLDRAVEDLQKAGGFERFMAMLEEIQRQSNETAQILTALVDDYQNLADMHDAGQEVLMAALIDSLNLSEEQKDQARARFEGAILQRFKEIQQARKEESAEQGA